MEKIASRKYTHDHASAFKNRGDKMGLSNRFVRQHRTNEERKNTRMDAMAKRRRLPLAAVNEENNSLLEDSIIDKKELTKTESAAHEPMTETVSRKEMLMKWKAERELKRKAGASQKSKKSVFAVRHIQHVEDNLFPKFKAPQSKQAAANKTQTKENVPVPKRVTRSSARLASKPSNSKATAVKVSKKVPSMTPSTVKKPTAASTVKKPTAAASSAKDQPRKRMTRQTAKLTEKAVNPSFKGKIVDEIETQPKENQEFKGDVEIQQENSSQEVAQSFAPNDLENSSQEVQAQSFAPNDFNFSVPEGVGNSFLGFKFKPLSPSSADGFFSGASFSPAEKSRELITKENFILTSQDWIKKVTEEAPMETEQPAVILEEQPLEDCNNACNAEAVVAEAMPTAVETEHDNAYFRDLVISETKKLNELSGYWEKVLEEGQELSEEVHGNIRTAIGQAQLLISQRFKQFSGLIDLSEDQTAEKKALSSDLQGFWDMIYFQVEDVQNKMNALEKQKENNWVEEKKQVKKRVKKTKPKTSNKQEASKPPRPGKSSIQEMRAKMRAKMAESRKKAMDIENEKSSFITILTPVKKGKISDVVLTPVRRSLRNTPLQKAVYFRSLAVVTTPKISGTSPGLRLTPEVSSTPEDPVVEQQVPEPLAQPLAEVKEDNEYSHEDQEMAPSSSEEKESRSESEVSAIAEEPMTCSSSDDADHHIGIKTRSVMRSAGHAKTRKNRTSRVSFQSTPKPTPASTAGGTPGPLVFTPGVCDKSTTARSIGVDFTPVAISLDTPNQENPVTTPENSTHGTPLRRSSRKRRLPTPYHADKSQSRLNEDELDDVVHAKHVCTPKGNHSDSDSEEAEPRVRSLRRSGRRSKGVTPRGATPIVSSKEEVLPDKYLLPSGSDEEDSDVNKDVEMVEEEPHEVAISTHDNSLETCEQEPAAVESEQEPAAAKSEARRVNLLKHVHDTSEETPSRQNTPLKTTLFISPESPAGIAGVSALLPLTPKQKSSTADQFCLTPASGLAALSLDGTPVSTATRRDSVFYAPAASQLLPKEKSGLDNLICFSPIDEQD